MDKIVTLSELLTRLGPTRKADGRVVFTNGCFDILHAGHVRYLAAARAQGDLLVVGLNSDKSVGLIKEKERPILPQDQRAEVIAALCCVDFVILFDEADPLALITAIQPDILVKGADWEERHIVGADIVKAGGGRIVRIPITVDVSTSGIIRRIIDRYQKNQTAKD